MEKINYEKAVKNIRKELEMYIVTKGLRSLVLGVSGGMDSALVAALASPVCKKLNVPLIGRSIPIQTNKQNELIRASNIGKAFCTDFKEVDLTKEFLDLKEIDFIDKITDSADDKSHKIRMGNIKARMRMVYLYNLAAKNKGLVLSTDNWTEYLLGFWTLHGDVGDYGMIQELWKTEVYNMGEWMCEHEFPTDYDCYNSLNDCIKALATDGLGVTDLGDLGQILPDWKGSSRDGYKEVDRILKIWTERDKLGDIQRTFMENMFKNHPVVVRHRNSDFKRNNPTNIPRNLIIN